MEELRYNDPEPSPEIWKEQIIGTEETHARQPTTRSRSQYNPSEDFSPITGKNWIDTTMLTSKNENLMEQFTGSGWVRFGKKEEIPLIGSIIFGKEATKNDFNIARTSATLC